MISIILPTYNRAQFLPRAIKSILNQTYSNWELIIIDDGSTDNTEYIVKKFLKDKRIKYFKEKKNLGGSEARNIGIKKSTGNYITFLDSDDEYLKNKIEEQLTFFNKSDNKNLGVVTCGRLDYKNDKIQSKFIPRKKKNYYKSLLSKEKGIGAGTPFLMVKTDIIKKNNIFFDKNMPAMQDWDFLIRICKITEMDVVKKHLVKVNHHNLERIYNSNNVIKALQLQYNKYHTWLEEDAKAHFLFIKRSALLLAYHKNIKLSLDFINNIDFFSKEKKLKFFYLKTLLFLSKNSKLQKIIIKYLW
jgi:glycosyltransferase involved in cell wall biosynthesis